jgi:hypothetical protein
MFPRQTWGIWQWLSARPESWILAWLTDWLGSGYWRQRMPKGTRYSFQVAIISELSVWTDNNDMLRG